MVSLRRQLKMRGFHTRSGMRLHALRVGCIAFAAFIAAACQSVPRVSPRPALVAQQHIGVSQAHHEAESAAPSPEFEGGDTLIGGNMATLLWDGPQTVASMKDAI